MKVLLLDPTDVPFAGPWGEARWDFVVDLGWSGNRATYADWSGRLGCPVVPLDEFGREYDDYRNLGRLLDAFRGRLIDRLSLDWWDFIRPYLQQDDLRCALLLPRMVGSLPQGSEFYSTRRNALSQSLARITGKEVLHFADTSRWRDLRRRIRRLGQFPIAQVVEILFDKLDMGYRIRGRIARPRRGNGELILLPSAYGSVSRTLVSYARILPDLRFRLVYSRASGWLRTGAPNVDLAPLACYAEPFAETKGEVDSLLSAAGKLVSEINEGGSALAYVDPSRLLSNLNWLLVSGLRIRDAWRRVFDQEDVRAVLCADEANYVTRLPVLLGKLRGIPTVSCHHGALDGQFLLNELAARTFIARTEMERDFLVHYCGLPADRVALPPQPDAAVEPPRTTSRRGTHAVFFAEAWGNWGERPDRAYPDVVTRLCALARKHGRRVMVKLHPMENRRAVEALLRGTLTRDDYALVDIVGERLTSDLLDKVWFGIIIASTVALELAQEGIDCFACGWLENPYYPYAKHYVRFGIAQRLDRQEDIGSIPDILRRKERASVRTFRQREISAPFVRALLRV